jgi:2-succinyl-6-hydroxy-2,4-cyclohexadiene-1-carboxylate synthase
MSKNESSQLVQFLHGFLGSSHDWEDVISYLPNYRCEALEYPFEIAPNAIIVGYSMGGRIALRYPNRKIVISSHPGLKTFDEKQNRFFDEQKWIGLLQTVPFSDFVEMWYEQPLFCSFKKNSCFDRMVAKRLQGDPAVFLKMLETERLSQQEYRVDAFFICGELDFRYKKVYKENNIVYTEIAGAGHACHLENPRAVAEALLSFFDRC